MTIRLECRECCYGVSSPFGSNVMYNKADAHEADTGHHMEELLEEALYSTEELEKNE